MNAVETLAANMVLLDAAVQAAIAKLTAPPAPPVDDPAVVAAAADIAKQAADLTAATGA